MGVCRTPLTSLLIATVTALCLAAPAHAARPDPEDVAQAALSDMESLIAICEQDAAEFKSDSEAQLTLLAERLPPEKAAQKIEKTGEKLFSKFGKLRAKMEKRVDKVAIKAANRIAKFGGDPALILMVDEQRIALREQANLMLDEVWGEIAEIQQAIIDDLETP